MNPKIPVILGPTASGKSALALKLAQEQNGEIISVDSRQIYRRMDIGTGKVTKEEQASVPHHLLDIVEPETAYNVTDFVRDARAAIEDIQSRGKLPILCGGSGFWAQALIENQSFPEVPPDRKLREKLDTYSKETLLAMLEAKDPERASTIDPENKIRLIRALEIIETLGKVPEEKVLDPKAFDTYTIIALNLPRDVLRGCIERRLEVRFTEGMIEEVQRLLAQGVSHEWLQDIGLEYRFISHYLKGELALTETKEQLFYAIWHYAKRQLTWLRRMEERGWHIEWRES